MIDLDRDVRGLLRDRAGKEEGPRELPTAVRRRVRARQSGVVAGVLAMILVIAVPIVAAPGWFDRKDDNRRGETTDPITSTVYGVSITYPDDWTLLQLNDQLEMGGTRTSSLFQLSNFDPLNDSNWVCPLPSGSVPEGGVLLFVQEILTGETTAPWPVELREGPAVFDTCGQKVARWQSGGRIFEAGVVGDLEGAASGDLIEAFRSMAFESPDDDPPLGAQDVTVDHAYVLASGQESGEPWNLLAIRYRNISDNVVCILLDPIGPREGRCMPNPMRNDFYDFAISVDEVGGTLFAFGTAPTDARRFESLSGRRLQLAAIPSGLRVPYQVFVGPADELVADGVRLVEVRMMDAEGRVVDRRQWIEPSSVGEGARGVKAFDHAFGELWWLYDDGERIQLKTREGGIRSTGTRLLRAGEQLRVLTHTFRRGTEDGVMYETVVFGLSSGEGSQVTVVLATGEAVNASTVTLDYDIDGPDLIDLGHVFWASFPGAVRGEVVAVDAGCRVLARVSLRPDTPPPSLPSPPPEPELPCIGP